MAASDPSAWAWAVARNPTTAHYVPTAKDQGSSGGGLNNSVSRYSPGQYRVDFPGLGAGNGGDAQVSAIGSSARYCNVSSFGVTGPGVISVYVSCFNVGGAYIDSAFTVLFVQRGNDSAGLMAFAWADQQSTPDYTPNTAYQNPGTITIHRSGPGSYVVRIPGADASHGNVQVTGYGAIYCKAGDISHDATAMLIDVLCPSGDALYDIMYTKNVGMTNVARPKAAYLRAHPLAAASHRLPTAFRYSSTSSTPSINRTGVGAYVVTLPGMPKGGFAHVTAGSNTYYVCFLTSIRTTATPQKIGVKCTTTLGQANDANFDLSYTK